MKRLTIRERTTTGRLALAMQEELPSQLFGRRTSNTNKTVAVFRLPITMDPEVTKLEYWEDLVIRTHLGTILPEASLTRFSYEFQSYLQGDRTGVYAMNTATTWVQTFIQEHDLDVQSIDLPATISIAEKELNAFIKHERAAIEAATKTKKLAERSLHKAFDTLGTHQAPREAILSLAALEMKTEPAQLIAVMQQLRDFVKESGMQSDGVFYIGSAPNFFYGRKKDSKGGAVEVPLSLSTSNGSTPSGTNKPKKYMKSIQNMGFTTKELFLQASRELGSIVENGNVKVPNATDAQLAAWLVARKK